jgi:fibronectin type 3 domain-containing protein
MPHLPLTSPGALSWSLRVSRPVAPLAWLGLALLLSSGPLRANLPNGGNGTGTNVTLVNNGNGTVTMQNGIVSALINISTAQIFTLTYNGTQLTSGGTGGTDDFYWQGTSGSADTLVTVVNPSANGGNYAEIDLEDPAANSGNLADAHRHFSMFRGSPGIYVTEIMTRSATAAAGGASIPSLTCKLGSSPMNWLATDGGDPRFLAMPNVNDLATATSGVNFAPKEVTLLTSGNLAGQFDCKYDYAGDLGALTATGWCSNTSNIGIWMVHPSDEYFSSGPMHREILTQLMLLNNTFGGVHFGFNDDENFSAGETWTRVCGPFFIYLNKVAQGTTNPAAALWTDAQAQAQAERGAWPYSWFTDGNYTQASGRGTVTGKIIINDSGNPNASPAGLWVGVAQQPPSATSPLPADFQQFGKRYQFWTKTDANGNFTIPNVVAGSNYTLFAFGPGAIGQFQSQVLSGATIPVTLNYPSTPFSVTVTGGNTTALGNLTWTPTRTGNTVWEIGVPDRNTQEFRHGDDYWHGDHGTAAAPAENWAPWENFSLDFPNGLTYVVGSSHWANDWDYAQPTVLDPTTGNENVQAWTITFSLPQAPVGGATACIYMGIAADFDGPVEVTVNNTNLGSTSGVTATPTSISSTGFFPYYSGAGCDAMIRMSSHGIFCDERITFPGSLLKSGANTITLFMRKAGYFSNSALYDYVRLELAGYIPPAPNSLTALAGNAQIVLRWPAAPGATSYNLLRSTTSGSAYATLASNITGPVSGSTNDIATYTDSTVSNGTPYYYVVESVNPSGSSANSTQATATPSSSISSAPAAPTGPAATPGNGQVTLNWTPSANAAYYLISRSLISGGPYTSVNSTVTVPPYTDPARSNAITYYYVVAAANAAGTSANSTEVSATPYPTSVPSTPTDLTITTGTTGITLSWTPITGATNYIVERATSPGGPYTILTSISATSFFADTTASGNTTYYYTVTAANLAGLGANSTVLTLTSPPDPPANLTASPGNTTVTLDWTASAGATSYLVQRGTASGTYTNTFTATGTSYVDTGLTNGVTYYYAVAAVNANGTSVNSDEVSAVPAVQGGNQTWNGGDATNGDWSDTDNWVGGAAPGGTAVLTSPDVATFNSAISGQGWGNSGTPVIIDQTTQNIGGISFDAAAGNYTIGATNGHSLLLTANGTTQILSTLSSTNAQEKINAPLLLEGNYTFANNSPTGTGAGEGTLDFGGNITAASGVTAILTLAGNNANANTITGNVANGGGNLSVTKTGTGAWTFANANYTGAITVNAASGTLIITGGSTGSSSVTDTVGTANGLIVSGGTITAGTINIGTTGGQTGAGASISGSGSAVFGNVTIGSSSNTGGSLTINTSGTVNLGAYFMGRDSGGAAANTGGGLILTSGTVIATRVASGSGVGGRASDLNLNGGSLTIGTSSSTGGFALGSAANPGNYFLTMTGGALTYLGTDGLLVGDSTTGAITTGVSITAGTATLTGITLNAINSASATSTLTLSSGATLYLGGVGLVLNQPTSTVTASFGTTTVGAIANWTSSAPITLTGTTTFQAADSTTAAHNITLNGILSGAGGLTKTGLGNLTLAATNTYAGATTVSAGNLVLTGSLAGSAAVQSGATVSGTGKISGNLTVSSGGGLSLNSSGNLAVTGNVTLGTALTVTAAASLTVGNYTLLGYGGTLTGTPAFTYVPPAGASQAATFNTATAHVITVTVFGPPATPTGLTATPGNGNITLNWTGSTGAANYTIQRSTTSGSGYATLATGVTALTFKDLTAANGTTYYYVVVSNNAAGSSANSTQTSATPVAPPAAPTNLAATPGNTTVALTWNTAANATTYLVQRATVTGGPYTGINTTAAANYTDTGLTDGVTFYYVVAATDAGGTGPNSAEVSAIPAQSLTQWTAAYFPGISDANITGPSADPDGDGLTNLEEYLLGTNPTVPDSPGSLITTNTDGSGNLVITFHVSKNLTGITYKIHQSTDMLNWTDTGVTPTIQSDQGTYYIMQAPVPLGANPHLYLKLTVTGQ